MGLGHCIGLVLRGMRRRVAGVVTVDVAALVLAILVEVMLGCDERLPVVTLLVVPIVCRALDPAAVLPVVVIDRMRAPVVVPVELRHAMVGVVACARRG